jgi:hypothetical protein
VIARAKGISRQLFVAGQFPATGVTNTLTDCAILTLMAESSILTDEFAEAVARAGRLARQDELVAGYPVVFIDRSGLYIEERPDGTRLEIRLDPTRPRQRRRG